MKKCQKNKKQKQTNIFEQNKNKKEIQNKNEKRIKKTNNGLKKLKTKTKVWKNVRNRNKLIFLNKPFFSLRTKTAIVIIHMTGWSAHYNTALITKVYTDV